MIAYIDMFRDRFGVESICRVLGATDRGFIPTRVLAKPNPVE